MLVVAGHIRLDPARRDEAIAAARPVVEATRQEPGCISYTITADLTDPGLFNIFEEWASGESLEAHFATPHMASFQAAMAGLGILEVAVQRYEIASVGPVRG